MDILFQGVVGDDASGTGTIDDNIDLAAATLEVLVVDVEQRETRQQHQNGQQRVEHCHGTVGQQVVARQDVCLIVGEIDAIARYCRHQAHNQDTKNVVETHMPYDVPV